MSNNTHAINVREPPAEIRFIRQPSARDHEKTRSKRPASPGQETNERELMLAQLATEFMRLGIATHGIVATPEHKRKFPRSVTIVTTTKLDDQTVDTALVNCEVDYWQHKRYRHQSMESHMKQAITSRFAPAGVAICDHRATPDPALGKVIAEGRLLKILRQQETNQ